MKEFVEFLGEQAPYDALSGADLERLARTIEVEFFPAETFIVPEGSEPLSHLYVIRTGMVDVIDRGRVIDELGEGETFGHVSVLSGLEPAFSVKAVEDTLCYRMPDPRETVSEPDRLRFTHYGSMVGRRRLTVERRLLEQGSQPVRAFARPVVWCEPGTRIREVAQQITDARQSSALIRRGDEVGIVTDFDFRKQVATGAVPIDAPIETLARFPALTIADDASVATAFLDMVTHGVHHLVVTDGGGLPAGVVRVVDLTSSEVRDPLMIRAAIDSASSLDDLKTAVQLLPSTAVELYDADVPPTRMGMLLSTIKDALIRKLLLINDENSPAVGVSCSWLVLGSGARHEPLPSSDIDTGIVWADPIAPFNPADAVRQGAERVLESLEMVGLQRCPDGANANNPLFSKSASAWKAAASGWVTNPTSDGALLLSSMLADSRPLTELALGRSVLEAMLAQARNRPFMESLLAFTIQVKPPTGFVRDFVVEHSGEHRGELNLKAGGMRPVVSLGRWASIVIGDSRGTTPERLRRAAAEGLLTDDEADTLVGAFEQFFGLLVAQDVQAIKDQQPSTTYIDPSSLDSLARRHLRESFRAIAQVQGRLEGEWVSRIT